MRCYFASTINLYHNSPKKSKELAAIYIGMELKEVFHFPKGGDLPVRCQGTRSLDQPQAQSTATDYGVL